jgi:hypothetical protein
MFGDIKPLIMAAILFDASRVMNTSKFSSEFEGRVVGCTDSTPPGGYPRFDVEIETSPEVPAITTGPMANRRAAVPAVRDTHIIMAFQLPQTLVSGHGTENGQFDVDAFIGMSGKRSLNGKFDKTGTWASTDCVWGV